MSKTKGVTPIEICGWHFTESDLRWLREQINSIPDLTRVRLSRLFCRHAGWLKPDGGLKEGSCRVALLRLHRRGLIQLPPPKTRPPAAWIARRTDRGEPMIPIYLKAGQVDLAFEVADRKSGILWNELMDRYHYLGYGRQCGAQLRVCVYSSGIIVALLGYSSAAWKLAPREAFIGWNEEQRKRNLHLLVNNTRFLILPWVHSRNLASRILSGAARKLPDLWQERYHVRPVLLETFVEKDRFSGTCYKAANWICVGETKGLGRWCKDKHHTKPIKTIWLYPLDRRFREYLCGSFKRPAGHELGTGNTKDKTYENYERSQKDEKDIMDDGLQQPLGREEEER